jgi:methylmalonyl-CoA/ethylmalonyl-CoA epimerase
MLKKIQHLGIIVEDLDQKIKKFEGFGLRCTQVIEKKEDGLKLAFFPIGDTLIELIHSAPPKELDHLTNVVRSHKDAVNHICFEVDDMDAAIRDFEKNGARLIEGSLKAGATGKIAFFYPETTEGILIELCEP